MATVDAILQAAAYILQKYGWAGFTTNLVAERAGVNIGSLYQYFPNKQAIVAELQRRHVQRARQNLPPPEPGKTLADYLRATIEAGVKEHLVDPTLHRIFADELPRSSRINAREGAPDTERAWEMAMAPLTQVPDFELASFISTTAAHAVIHEAAINRPELLQHPLFIEEVVALLDRYLRRSKSGNIGGAPR
ncbi:MAG: TetR/AcrR family transcriptional regulator [Archangium sp.]